MLVPFRICRISILATILEHQASIVIKLYKGGGNQA